MPKITCNWDLCTHRSEDGFCEADEIILSDLEENQGLCCSEFESREDDE